MVNSRPEILVTGATGRQGGATVRHLLGRGYRVRALCRDPASRASAALASAGVRVHRGDLEDRDSLAAAMAGVHGVFSVQNYWDGAPAHKLGVDGEVRQGRNVLDAAKAAGVVHVVQASGAGVTTAPHIEANRGKLEVERYGRALGMAYTVIRGVYFMDNFDDPKLGIAGPILEGRLEMPFDPDTRLQLVATDDIGHLAAMAFDRPREMGTSTFDAAGEELTMLEIAETFSRVLGRPVRFTGSSGSLAEVRRYDPDLGELFTTLYEVGFMAFIPALRALHPGMLTLEGYLRRAGWGARAR